MPSGTKWATCNVGARKPSDAGLYFAWGDTSGYTAEQIGNGEGKKAFKWADYKFSINGSNSNFSKYERKGATLELEDDAAHVHMGGDWHMPTPEQIQELINTANTTNTWEAQNNVHGRLFTSKSDPSKSIFIPEAGYASGGSFSNIGMFGYVWSSMLDTDGARHGQYLYFNQGGAYLDSYHRYVGRSVRGVIG